MATASAANASSSSNTLSATKKGGPNLTWLWVVLALAAVAAIIGFFVWRKKKRSKASTWGPWTPRSREIEGFDAPSWRQGDERPMSQAYADVPGQRYDDDHKEVVGDERGWTWGANNAGGAGRSVSGLGAGRYRARSQSRGLKDSDRYVPSAESEAYLNNVLAESRTGMTHEEYESEQRALRDDVVYNAIGSIKSRLSGRSARGRVSTAGQGYPTGTGGRGRWNEVGSWESTNSPDNGYAGAGRGQSGYRKVSGDAAEKGRAGRKSTMDEVSLPGMPSPAYDSTTSPQKKTFAQKYDDEEAVYATAANTRTARTWALSDQAPPPASFGGSYAPTTTSAPATPTKASREPRTTSLVSPVKTPGTEKHDMVQRTMSPSIILSDRNRSDLFFTTTSPLPPALPQSLPESKFSFADIAHLVFNPNDENTTSKQQRAQPDPYTALPPSPRRAQRESKSAALGPGSPARRSVASSPTKGVPQQNVGSSPAPGKAFGTPADFYDESLDASFDEDAYGGISGLQPGQVLKRSSGPGQVRAIDPTDHYERSSLLPLAPSSSDNHLARSTNSVQTMFGQGQQKAQQTFLNRSVVDGGTPRSRTSLEMSGRYQWCTRSSSSHTSSSGTDYLNQLEKNSTKHG